MNYAHIDEEEEAAITINDHCKLLCYAAMKYHSIHIRCCGRAMQRTISDKHFKPNSMMTTIMEKLS